MATGIDQPLADHRDVGVGGIDFCNNTNQRAENKRLAVAAEQIERFVRRLHERHNVCLKGKAGQTDAEVLGLGIFSGGIDHLIICIGILRFDIMQILAPERLGQGRFSGLASSGQKHFFHIK